MFLCVSAQGGFAFVLLLTANLVQCTTRAQPPLHLRPVKFGSENSTHSRSRISRLRPSIRFLPYLVPLSVKLSKLWLQFVPFSRALFTSIYNHRYWCCESVSVRIHGDMCTIVKSCLLCDKKTNTKGNRISCAKHVLE